MAKNEGKPNATNSVLLMLPQTSVPFNTCNGMRAKNMVNKTLEAMQRN